MESNYLVCICDEGTVFILLSVYDRRKYSKPWCLFLCRLVVQCTLSASASKYGPRHLGIAGNIVYSYQKTTDYSNYYRYSLRKS